MLRLVVLLVGCVALASGTIPAHLAGDSFLRTVTTSRDSSVVRTLAEELMSDAPLDPYATERDDVLADENEHHRERFLHENVLTGEHAAEDLLVQTESRPPVDALSDRFEPLRIQYITTNLNEGVYDKLCTTVGSSVQVPCHNSRETCTVQCTDANTFTAERRTRFLELLNRVKTRMEGLLLVQRTQSNTINYQGHVRSYAHCASAMTTPQSVDISVFVTLKTSSDPRARRWVGGASGGTCLSDTNGKPVAGVLLITADAFIGTGHYATTWEETVMHELVHVLQYSMPEKTFPYGEVVKVGEQRYLRSPLALKFAREHFQCPTLPGALLENDRCHCHLQLDMYRDAYMSPVAGRNSAVLTQITLGWIADTPFFKLSPTARARANTLSDREQAGRDARCAPKPDRLSCPNNNCGDYGSCIGGRCVCHDVTDTSPGCTAARTARVFHPSSGRSARQGIVEAASLDAANLMGPGAPGGAQNPNAPATTDDSGAARPRSGVDPNRRMNLVDASCVQVNMNRTPCKIINTCEGPVRVSYLMIPKLRSVGQRRNEVTLAPQAEWGWPNSRKTVKICVRVTLWVYDATTNQFLGRRSFAEGEQVSR